VIAHLLVIGLNVRSNEMDDTMPMLAPESIDKIIALCDRYLSLAQTNEILLEQKLVRQAIFQYCAAALSIANVEMHERCERTHFVKLRAIDLECGLEFIQIKVKICSFGNHVIVFDWF
jgi:hypothetical protein